MRKMTNLGMRGERIAFYEYGDESVIQSVRIYPNGAFQLTFQCGASNRDEGRYRRHPCPRGQ